MFFKFIYNLFAFEFQVFREYLNDVLTKKWIWHFINSTNASILFVSKKNDELRLCVNYRELNKVILKNCHSLSLITQMLDQLVEKQYFIKLDLKNVYHRIRIREDNEWKTTFRTRYEHFEYTVMFFDLINASTTFQVYINKILARLINVFCVIYLNDILIYFDDRNTHVEHVQQILKRLQQYNL